MATTLHSSDITGVQKAAILLIALGPERSSKIFQHLKDDEIEALTHRKWSTCLPVQPV